MKKTAVLIFILTFGLFSNVVISQNGLSLDGINDYVDCGNSATLNITGAAITMEAWIYPTSWKFNVWEGNIISKEGVGTGYMLRAGSNGTLNMNLGNGPGPGSWHELSSSSGVLTLNTWQHIAGTYDGSYMRLYVNGVIVDSIAKTILVTGTNTVKLYLGESPSYSGRYFPGILDEVRVWNTARTKSEIISNMNSEMCVIPSALKAYYTFNQGVASGTNIGLTSLNDASGNGNNGTLSGLTLSGTVSNWVTGATVTPGVRTTLFSDTVCTSYSTPSGRIISTTGITYDTLISAGGCDSLLMFDISISSVDDSVYRVGGRITSYDTWATHQWVRCDSGYAPISGETNRFLTATSAGDYAVIVSRGNCKDTSVCVNISLTTITENKTVELSIYPNPVSDVLHIEGGEGAKEVSIYSLHGQFVDSLYLTRNQINVEHLKSGIYILQLKNKEHIQKIKFIKN